MTATLVIVAAVRVLSWSRWSLTHRALTMERPSSAPDVSLAGTVDTLGFSGRRRRTPGALPESRLRARIADQIDAGARCPGADEGGHRRYVRHGAAYLPPAYARGRTEQGCCGAHRMGGCVSVHRRAPARVRRRGAAAFYGRCPCTVNAGSVRSRWRCLPSGAAEPRGPPSAVPPCD
jgi:hypothetical protein